MPETLDAGVLVAAVRRALAPHADAARAVGIAAYMQGRFPFLGVPTSVRRQLTLPLIKAWSGLPLVAAHALWAEPVREFQYVACDLLARHTRRLASADLDGLLALAAAKSWWDTVDGLAKRVGDLVRRAPSLIPRLDALIDDENLWLRRIALLHQLGWKEATDPERLFATACAGPAIATSSCARPSAGPCVTMPGRRRRPSAPFWPRTGKSCRLSRAGKR